MENNFENIMEELSRKHERSVLFVDFMDYYITQQSNNQVYDNKRYTKDEHEQLEQAYTYFKEHVKRLIEEHGWYDYIGEYYEEFVLSGSKASSKGQFYTPRNISKLLTELVGTPEDDVPYAYDPACGSARNLLEYHSKHKTALLVGEDLDESACKMAVINFHLHGVSEAYVHHIDALTREYMGTSWVIIHDQIYITDMEWIEAVNTVRYVLTGIKSPELLLLLNIQDNYVVQEKRTVEKKEGLDGWIKSE